jgi:hypothetical protein
MVSSEEYGPEGTEAMTSARREARAGDRTGADSAIDSKAAATAELMLEVAQCFFRIRAIGQKTGLITSWGGGAFGFMRSLALLGPLTVPQIAQMRPTSRQRMQRLADELAGEGLVEFIATTRSTSARRSYGLRPRVRHAIVSSTAGSFRLHRS